MSVDGWVAIIVMLVVLELCTHEAWHRPRGRVVRIEHVRPPEPIVDDGWRCDVEGGC